MRRKDLLQEGHKTATVESKPVAGAECHESTENGYASAIFEQVEVVPYANGIEELSDSLSRLNAMLRFAVRRARGLYARSNGRGLDGIAISDAEIDAFLDSGAWTREDRARPEDQRTEQQFYQEIEADRLRCEIRAAAGHEIENDLRLSKLAQQFGLSGVEIDICLMCLAPEIHPGYGRLYAYLHNDITRPQPTVALTLELFARDWQERIEIRRLLAGNSPLVEHGLISVTGNRENPLENVVSLDETLLSFLLGEPLERILAPCPIPGESLEDLILDSADREALQNLRQVLVNIGDQPEGPRIVVIRGPEGTGKCSAAAALVRAVGRTPLLRVFESWEPGRAVELRQWLRRVRIVGGWPIVDFSHLPAELADLALPEAIKILANSGCQCELALSGEATRPPNAANSPGLLFTLDLKVPGPSFRREAWMCFLQEEGVACEVDEVRTTAAIFPFAVGKIKNTARAVAARLRFENSGNGPINSKTLNEACRAQCTHRLGQIADLLPTKCGWKDLVLPPDELARLKEIAGAVRNRERVLEQWAFGDKICPRAGVSALFFGPSGTGKTMAASILANELAMEIYRVDLSRVVSKYIGETEKNLDTLFEEARRAHAIVFFDEAEAVFGKRSEVKDAHDRYSNIEVAYLLQRIEAFDGVAILATNLRKNMDNAFMRRLQFAVEFPAPTYEQRLRIWRGVWPSAAEVAPDVDLEFMARNFEMTGGHIRNIALMSAFLAAQEGQAISMAYVVQATYREFQKLGRLCIDSEFGGYKHFLRR